MLSSEKASGAKPYSRCQVPESMPILYAKRIPRPGKLGKEWARLLNFPLPDLSRRKVRVSGPEAYGPPTAVLYEPPIEESPLPPIEREKSAEKSRSKEKSVPDIRSKTVSAAERQSTKSIEKKTSAISLAPSRGPARRVADIKPEEEIAAIVSAPPKPLKVIRRRGEQAPKVFETPPRTVPLAMLEGIAPKPDEDVDA